MPNDIYNLLTDAILYTGAAAGISLIVSSLCQRSKNKKDEHILEARITDIFEQGGKVYVVAKKSNIEWVLDAGNTNSLLFDYAIKGYEPLAQMQERFRNISSISKDIEIKQVHATMRVYCDVQDRCYVLEIRKNL